VDKIEHVLETLRSKGKMVFSSLFADVASRNEIVCTFLAVLELIRLRQIVAQQDSDFGEIVTLMDEFRQSGLSVAAFASVPFGIWLFIIKRFQPPAEPA
jgi:segregation and condensation protein A